jgi:hypothetical protein
MGTATAVAGALALVGCGSAGHPAPRPAAGGQISSMVAATSTTTEKSPAATAVSVTAPTVAGEPADFVATTLDQRVVTVSPSTGQITRVLVGSQPEGAPSDLALSPDHRTVWFSRSEGTCVARLATVPRPGGPEQAVPGSGASQRDAHPALAPDGHMVAFTRDQCSVNNTTAGSEIVVTPTGDAAHAVRTYPGVRADALAWSPDGALIAAGGPEHNRILLLPVSETGGEKVLMPPDPGCGIDHPLFETSHPALLAAENCAASAKLVELDLASGTLRRTVATLSAGAIGSSFTLDASGHLVLYSTATTAGAASTSPTGRSLFYLDLTATKPSPVRIPSGGTYLSAVW